jgi:tartrate-resistant acid phosphatase type 5
MHTTYRKYKQHLVQPSTTRLPLALLAIVLTLALLALAGCGATPTAQVTANASTVPSSSPAPYLSPTLAGAPPEASDTASAPQTPEVTTTSQTTPSLSPSPEATLTAEAPVRFAVIGDYGQAGDPEAEVARLVHDWGPDLVLTTGDNNYPDGSAETIDDNIGQYYSAYIGAYQGIYGDGAAQNRFFPSPGNHDWRSRNLEPYIDYFNLPGNERYYDFVRGPVHFFAVDSDSNEPDGVHDDSVQAQWLEAALAASTEPWNIVYMHHLPYSSGRHGPVKWMRWPFKEWGATAVLGGHDHTYERLEVDGLVYFVNGLGGNPSRYSFTHIQDGSQIRFNGDYGAMLVEATSETITFEFVTRADQVIDTYTMTASKLGSN